MEVETTPRKRDTITVSDGTEILFKDWGVGQPIVFSHGSPLDSDAWNDQMFEDLKTIDVPTLILHGDDDQIVPVAASAILSAALVKGSTLKVYPGFSNGMCTINKDQINADLLAFVKSA